MGFDAGASRQLAQKYSWIALTLAGVGGAVDGTGYLMLQHVFTSHMSGNTVAMMLYVAQGDWARAWTHVEPIVIFFCSILAGLGFADVLMGARVTRMFALIAGLELALVGIFFWLAHPPQQWMVVFPASAMGVQNAMLRRAGHHNVRTTFVTGILTSTAQGLTEGKFREFFFYGGIWLCFAVGGVSAALIYLAHGRYALLLPMSVLAVLIAVDIARPVTSARSEQASGGEDG